MSGLTFVGLGLSGTDGMTMKAFNALCECDVIFAEFYGPLGNRAENRI
jgi:diphthine synthase